jgi:hypothetical protein
MVRVNKARIVVPGHAHETHLASRLALLSVRRVRRAQEELAADKSRKPKAPALAGAVGDGTALRNLTTLLHEAGLVSDQTVLGFAPGAAEEPPPALVAHSHDIALFRFANANKNTTPVLVDHDDQQTIWSFTLNLTDGVKYNIVADAVAEGYSEVGSPVEVRLGIQIGSDSINWGSSTSSENESAPVAASAAAADFVASGDVTITVLARREVTTAQCWIRAGHAKAFALQAETLGYILS